MIRISKLAASVQPSATLAAGAKARQLRAAGVKVYDFSLGEPDFDTPKHICEAAERAALGGQTHYTPTKAGLHSLMQSAAIALGRHNIRCNSLFPGTILTDINKDDLADENKRRSMEGRVPLGRLGQPEDLVGPTVFLASDLARYVTGASLLVDGGLYVNLQ